MKTIAKMAAVGVLTAGLIFGLVAVLFSVLPGQGDDTAQAEGGSGGYPAIFGIDVDPFDGNGNGTNIGTAGDGTPEAGAACLDSLDNDLDLHANEGCDLGLVTWCIEVESSDSDFEAGGAPGDGSCYDGVDNDGDTTCDYSGCYIAPVTMKPPDPNCQGTPGPYFDIDTFINDIPTGQDLAAINMRLLYDQTLLNVNDWRPGFYFGTKDGGWWLMGSAAGSAVGPSGDTTFPDSDGTLNVATPDTGGAGSEETGSSLGVLDRYQIAVVGSGPAITYLSTAPAPKYFANVAAGAWDPDWIFDGQASRDNDGDGSVDEDPIDGVDNDGDCVGTPPATPPGPCSTSGGVDEDPPYFGVIAIDTACPVAENADVEKLVLEPQGLTGWPDVELDVCVETPFTLHEQLILNTDVAEPPVGTDITITACPEAGLMVSYHVTAEDLALPGDLLVTVNGEPWEGVPWDGGLNPPESTWFYVAGTDCLDVHKQVDLTYDTPLDLYEDWDLHCLEPSTHSIEFDNDILPKDPFLDDNMGNNHLDLDFSVDCIAKADFSVADAAVAAPDTALIDTAFDVTVSTNLTNGGPWGTATADVTLDLDLSGAADCSKVPDTSQEVEDSLDSGESAPAEATWSVTCTSLTTKTFGGSATVALDEPDPHIIDPEPGNDGPISATTDSTDIVAEQADVFVVSWAIAEDDLPNAGSQVLIVPGTPATITTQQIMDNAGPDGPATTDDNRSVADVAGVCVVTNNDRTTSYDLEVDNPVGLNETWSVSWIDDPKPPYWCDLTFNKLLTITDPGFSDPDTNNNDDSASVQVVLDSDGDGIPDDGDLSGSDSDNRCEPGESTFCDDNCEDVANPGQEDHEGDGLGDVCDPDDDDDGVEDVDDNCPLIWNPNQEDADADGIGDVCELDVDCDDDLDITDVVMILQYIVGLANPSVACPPSAGYINAPRASAYVAYDPGQPELVGTIIDAVMGLQCIVGRHNIVCPAIP